MNLIYQCMQYFTESVENKSRFGKYLFLVNGEKIVMEYL